jgi:hypothetical protein
MRILHMLTTQICRIHEMCAVVVFVRSRPVKKPLPCGNTSPPPIPYFPIQLPHHDTQTSKYLFLFLQSSLRLLILLEGPCATAIARSQPQPHPLDSQSHPSNYLPSIAIKGPSTTAQWQLLRNHQQLKSSHVGTRQGKH